MSRPVVRVAGRGPADASLMTQRVRDRGAAAPVARLRTRRHPAAAHPAFVAVESYDAWYEDAQCFEGLYDAIVEDLCSLAASSPTREVLYLVPGSPVVAESTVERLRVREDVATICEPSTSVIDLACAVMGRDPMSAGLRVVDALSSDEPFTGPGPLLILQAYAPEVLAGVGARLPAATTVTVLHHLGLADQAVVERSAASLAGFDADHLTSLWVEDLRTAGVAMEDLVALARRLRRDCPWDIAQTHGSLARHLLEESYEAIDALEAFVAQEAAGTLTSAAVAHVEEELGDLLFQVVFHAELGDEEGRFDLVAIADALREKLIGRHPHVFGDAAARDAAEVASRWEVIKRDEKKRESAVDGVVWQQPALSLYAKLARAGDAVSLAPRDLGASLADARDALGVLVCDAAHSTDARSVADTAAAWGDALIAIVEAARRAGVDLEGVLRERAVRLAEAIRAAEAREGAEVDE